MLLASSRSSAINEVVEKFNTYAPSIHTAILLEEALTNTVVDYLIVLVQYAKLDLAPSSDMLFTVVISILKSAKDSFSPFCFLRPLAC